eukprot:6903740-Prymnesium_polylepis.1
MYPPPGRGDRARLGTQMGSARHERKSSRHAPPVGAVARAVRLPLFCADRSARGELLRKSSRHAPPVG